MDQKVQRDSQGYQNVGSIDKYPLLQAIGGAIFSKTMFFSLPNGTRLRTKLFKGKLFAVEYEGIRYVEQNTHTQSAYAARAREGARIVWIIRILRRDHVNWVPCNEWLGRIEDGIVWKK